MFGGFLVFNSKSAVCVLWFGASVVALYYSVYREWGWSAKPAVDGKDFNYIS